MPIPESPALLPWQTLVLLPHHILGPPEPWVAQQDLPNAWQHPTPSKKEVGRGLDQVCVSHPLPLCVCVRPGHRGQVSRETTLFKRASRGPILSLSGKEKDPRNNPRPVSSLSLRWHLFHSIYFPTQGSPVSSSHCAFTSYFTSTFPLWSPICHQPTWLF